MQFNVVPFPKRLRSENLWNQTRTEETEIKEKPFEGIKGDANAKEESSGTGAGRNRGEIATEEVKEKEEKEEKEEKDEKDEKEEDEGKKETAAGDGIGI